MMLAWTASTALDQSPDARPLEVTVNSFPATGKNVASFHAVRKMLLRSLQGGLVC